MSGYNPQPGVARLDIARGVDNYTLPDFSGAVPVPGIECAVATGAVPFTLKVEIGDIELLDGIDQAVVCLEILRDGVQRWFSFVSIAKVPVVLGTWRPVHLEFPEDADAADHEWALQAWTVGAAEARFQTHSGKAPYSLRLVKE